jgi:hypothetical protein
MPNRSLNNRRPSTATSTTLAIGASLVVAVYVGLPLLLAAQTYLGSLTQAVICAALIITAAVLIVLSMLRRTATTRVAAASGRLRTRPSRYAIPRAQRPRTRIATAPQRHIPRVSP